jgi:hypothetical protein
MKFKCIRCEEENDVDIQDLMQEYVEQGRTEATESFLTEKAKLEGKAKEKEILLERSQKAIEQGLQKTEKPSMELQGEVAEYLLEEALIENFPSDKISPIKKGQIGADVKQEVKNTGGFDIGTILFESKSTKAWSNGWVGKLRSDMSESNASIGIIVSKAFPAKQTDVLVQLEERIWLCKPGPQVMAFVKALRQGLINESKLKNLEDFSTKDNKEQLYEYVTGDFINQMKEMARVYMSLSDEMEAEKRQFSTKWKKREKELENYMKAMTGMVGSLQGIGVASIQIKALEGE